MTQTNSGPADHVEACPFQATLDLIGRKHALTILWALHKRSPQRFTELKEMVGVNPMTLTQRLQELANAGVIRRRTFPEIPPRVEYGLTGMGKDLMPLMDALDDWASQYPEITGVRVAAPTS